jgi:uncharacterized protein YkwD
VPGSPEADAPTSGAGRHRHTSRLPSPLGLAVLVAVLLLAFGAGAAVLRPNLAGDNASQDPASVAAAERDGGDPGGTGEFGTAVGAPAATPTPGPTPTVKPSPTRKASPTPKRTTSRPPAPRPAGGATSAQSGDENAVVTLTNSERAAAGCGPVKVNAKLAGAARLHSQDQAEHDNMSHTGSDGSSPWERSERAGYDNAIGENVAAGYRTAEAVMDGWMNSDGHRANILNCDARAIGVGLAYADNGTPYWTQMFGSVA